MIEGRAQDDKQEQSEGDGKPLAGKLMEDCVMITDGAMGGGVSVCVSVCVTERDKETKEECVYRGIRERYGIVGIS